MPKSEISKRINAIVTALAQLIAVSCVVICVSNYFIKSLMTTKAVQIASIHQIQVALVTTAIAIPMTKKIRNWLSVMGLKVVPPF